MKSFKNYIKEASLDDEALYVVVKNGKAHLCTTRAAGPCNTFGYDVANALLQGDFIITTSTDGKTQTWRLDRGTKTVIGPLTTR